MPSAITSGSVAFAPEGASERAVMVTTTPLATGETVLGIGPEGDLWMADAESAWGLAPDGAQKSLPASLLDASWVSVRSASLGLAVVDGTLLEVRGPIRSPCPPRWARPGRPAAASS